MDLVDFPLSLPHLVVDELLRAVKSKRRPGTGVYNLHLPTPILIVGNKFDLMPAGTQKEDTRQRIEDYLIKHKLSRNVQGIHLVSAKHPSGDEILQLINHIVRLWPRACKGSVVIVGAENVGKNDREKQTRQKKLNILLGSKSAFSDTKGSETEEIDLTIPALQKDRGVKKYNEFNVTVSNMPGTTLGRVKVPLSVLSRFMKADYKEVGKKWIVDTPGIRNSQGQISDWLTLEELKVSLPTKKLKPMSFTLEEGKSFFLGGLVRIDCISIESDASGTMGHHQRGSNPQPKITVFSSLPLHKTSMVNADKFMKQTMLGQLTVLQPPFGSPERLSVFPGLAHAFDRDLVIVNDPLYTASSQNLRTTAYTTAYMDPFVKLDARKDDNPRRNPIPSFNPRKKQEADLQLNGRLGICDLVFSGIGWVMISGKFQGPDQPVTLRVWTPKGQGAIVRDVCLLPEWATNPIEKTAGGIRQKQKIFQELPSESSSSELLMDI
ncbi:nitric oxide associated protein 1 [Modicella reniformis]|uniref:Nitric oxide associated protein 1 n=1 Tax=Modicella reniformis TaxID=1440133 RepID=A0A9P6J3J1_9FUNG|nr:nitric oxide associated protein 1 [Modicella reniformis]